MFCERCRAEFCEIEGCTNSAVWEGWHRQRDGMGFLTGLITRRRVCDAHKALLNYRDASVDPKNPGQV